MCFFAGCNVDTENDIISGPEKIDMANDAILGMVNPVGSPLNRVTSRVVQGSTNSNYAGIRKASEFLQNIGVPRTYRKEILESYVPESIIVRPAGKNEYGIRYFDNKNAYPRGRYLFETFPANRQSLALNPRWNEMKHFKQWQIRPGSTVITGIAARQGNYSGGQLQKFIPNIEDLIEVLGR